MKLQVSLFHISETSQNFDRDICQKEFECKNNMLYLYLSQNFYQMLGHTQ